MTLFSWEINCKHTIFSNQRHELAPHSYVYMQTYNLFKK